MIKTSWCHTGRCVVDSGSNCGITQQPGKKLDVLATSRPNCVTLLHSSSHTSQSVNSIVITSTRQRGGTNSSEWRVSSLELSTRIRESHTGSMSVTRDPRTQLAEEDRYDPPHPVLLLLSLWTRATDYLWMLKLYRQSE